MTSIRKFAYTALLAATTLNFVPSLAAQESTRGKFTLTHEVRWGNANIPAGDYAFAYDLYSGGRTLSLSKLSGARTGYMLLVSSTEDSKTSDSNRLVLASASEGGYVRAMQLPEVGMTLNFPAPHVATKQLAATVTTASAASR